MATKAELRAIIRTLQERGAAKITPEELHSALKDIVESGEIYMTGSTRADEERRQKARATGFGLLEQQHEKARLENLRAYVQKVARDKREMSRQQKWLHAKGKKIATLQSRITALCVQRDNLMAQPPPPVAAVRSLKKQLGIRQPRDKTKAEQPRAKRIWRRHAKPWREISDTDLGQMVLARSRRKAAARKAWRTRKRRKHR